MKKNIMLTLFFGLIFVSTSSLCFSFTLTKHSSWTGMLNLFGEVVKTDSSTTCKGNGLLLCSSGPDYWQKVTNAKTLDGNPIRWGVVGEEVERDMVASGVPERSSNPGCKYLFEGIVYSNYINDSTNEYVYRSAIWKANSLKEYTYTTIINVIPIDHKATPAGW